jgi:hypothetical protein
MVDSGWIVKDRELLISPGRGFCLYFYYSRLGLSKLLLCF